MRDADVDNPANPGGLRRKKERLRMANRLFVCRCTAVEADPIGVVKHGYTPQRTDQLSRIIKMKRRCFNARAERIGPMRRIGEREDLCTLRQQTCRNILARKAKRPSDRATFLRIHRHPLF